MENNNLATLLQVDLCIIVLKTPPGRWFFEFFNKMFVILISFVDCGAEFIFGELITNTDKFGYIFGLKVLPTIVFFLPLFQFYIILVLWSLL